MSNEELKTTKKCKTCKKKELITELPEVEDIIIPTYDDIVKVYNILQVPSRLHDPINLSLAEKIFKEVTDQELEVRKCFSCKGSSHKRMFVYHAKEKYGIELK